MLSLIPINSLAWGFGAVAAIAMGVKFLFIYKKSMNLFSKYLGLFSLIIGIAFVFFSVPFALTQDTELLKDYQILGQFFVYLSFIYLSLVTWILAFRRKVSKYLITIPVTLLAVLATYLETLSDKVRLDTEYNLVIWNSPHAANVVEGILILITVVPIGIYLVRKALNEDTLQAKLKSMGIGFGYILIGASQALLNFFYGGEETVPKAYMSILLFIIMIMVAVIPNRHLAKSVKEYSE